MLGNIENFQKLGMCTPHPVVATSLGKVDQEENTKLFLLEPVHYLPKTIRLYIPHKSDARQIHLCVGIEEKGSDDPIYSSSKKTLDIQNVNERFKEFLVIGLFKEFYNYL